MRPLALNLLPITRVYFIFFKLDCLRVCSNKSVDAALNRLNNAVRAAMGLAVDRRCIRKSKCNP